MSNEQQGSGRARRVTIFDVAAASGVSRGTISRYLNGNGYVSEAARQAIKDAVEEVGYVPNMAARSLATRQTKNIAFVVHESHNMFYNDPNLGGMLTAANRVLSDADFQLVILILDSEQTLGRIATHLRGGYVDGAILVSVRAEDPLLGIVQELGIPAAMAGRPAGQSSVPWVDVDNAAAARDISARLLGTGRKRIAMIEGPEAMRAAQERLVGFTAALGAGFDANLVIPTPDWGHESGFAAMQELLHRDPSIDGVFAACDALAIGAMDALREAGKSIPDDVGVVGFDDSLWAKRSFPGLSTVQQPVEEMGARMASMVLRQLNGEDLSHVHEIVPTSIVWRDSA
ncbi:LacI family DNA-binding transcriptional regulator [Arthrobacter sp.]|uniref:LacI family DNA-binding transcriptional regulator n=1 Tax=Arthrobacter sp. TaxID=1667 RepID=UPI0026DEFE90|nr:LacI family DNA-binding transcriptional regulator [Arthrobacter sp.]MDO5754025.1 LacI family DNA-binding transcriptional regulator [Arthrobacter sp.]